MSRLLDLARKALAEYEASLPNGDTEKACKPCRSVPASHGRRLYQHGEFSWRYWPPGCTVAEAWEHSRPKGDD